MVESHMSQSESAVGSPAMTTEGIGRLRTMSDRALAWTFILPTIVLLLAINIFPLLWAVYLSFTNYRANQPGRE